MIRTELENRNGRRYLCVSSLNSPAPSGYRTRMLLENQIAGCCICRIREQDDTVRFCYDVTGLESVEDYFKESGKKADMEFLLLLIGALISIRATLADYLLPPDGLLLRPDRIFLDPEQTAFRFCYFPSDSLKWEEEAGALGEGLLLLLDHDDPEAVYLGYSFYQMCAEGKWEEEKIRRLQEGNVKSAWGKQTVRGAKEKPEAASEDAEREKLLDEFFSEEEEEPEALPLRRYVLPAAVSAVVFFGTAYAGYLKTGFFAALGLLAGWILLAARREEGKERAESARREEAGSLRRAAVFWPAPSGRSAEDAGPPDFPEDMETEEREAEELPVQEPFPDNEETCLLCAAPAEKNSGGEIPARLLPAAPPGTPAILSADGCLVGKNPAAADLEIKNPAVSRLHARIFRKDGVWQIVDLGSRNGTFRNGERLAPGKAYPLADGDELCFSVCRYIFEQRAV